MPKLKPGSAFSFETDLGYAVGLVTHLTPKWPDLIWIAIPTFPERPTMDQVREISEWRWPIGFPASIAMSRKIIEYLGEIEVPSNTRDLPVMRGRNPLTEAWIRVTFTEDWGHSTAGGETNDRSLPIFQIVNDTRLREMIESEYRPENEW